METQANSSKASSSPGSETIVANTQARHGRLESGSAHSDEKEVAAKTKRKTSANKKLDAVVLIYVPIHLGGSHRGVSMGPSAMRVADLVEKIKKMGLRVEEEIEIKVPYAVSWVDQCSTAKCVPEIAQVSKDVADAVEQAMLNDTIPITIGGDHSLAIGSIAGVASYYRKTEENFGLFWFDAHGDINTPDTSESGNVHGMPLAISLGQGDKRLTNLLGFAPKVQPHRTALIGIRSIDQGERKMINESGITPFTMRDIDHLGLARVTDLALGACGSDISGIHLSFDIDVVDPDVAPGVSCPYRGGLDYRESHLALEMLAETNLIRSIDMVEVNPAFDVRNKTAELAVELIQSSLGLNIL